MSSETRGDSNSVLETNLVLLFTRAYREVPVRTGFAAQVERAALAALPRPVALRWPLRTAAFAAAAGFLIAWLGAMAFARSDLARDRILARLEIAVRSEEGPWVSTGRGINDVPRLDGAEHGLELFVPAGRVAAVSTGPGALAFAGPAHARITPGGRTPEIEISAGAFSLRGFQGRISTELGAIECTDADLDFSSSDPETARAWLAAGRARFEARDGRREKLVRERLFTMGPKNGLPSSAPTAVAGSLPGVLGDVGAGRKPLPQEPTPTSAEVGPLKSISGRVRGPNAEPIASFSVILLRELELPDTADPIVHELVHPDGQFAFDSLEAGPWTVFVRAPGHALWTREHVIVGKAPAVLEVVLERGVGLTGRVIDAQSGAPIAGVTLLSESDVPTSLLHFGLDECPDNPSAMARSDASGRFVFEHLASTPTVVRATHAGYGPQWSAPLRAGTDGFELTIALSAGCGLAGLVEREDGSPCMGAEIVIMPQRAVLGLPRRSFGWVVTDASGAYSAQDLPAGSCVVVRLDVSGAGETQGEPRTEVRETRLREGEVQTVNFLASPQGSRLSGRLFSANSRPLSGTTISIMLRDAAAGATGATNFNWRSQVCGAEGAFEFTDVPPGNYDVFLGVRMPMDMVHVDVVEVPGARNVQRDFIAPAGMLHGAIRAASDARAVESAVVVLEREQSSGQDDFVAKVLSDANGQWRIPHLSDGFYRLRVYPGAGLAFAGRDGLEVRAGIEPSAVDLEFKPGRSLMLTVTDEQRRARSGVRVHLIDRAGMEFQCSRDPRTDGSGRLELDGLPKESLVIRLSAPEGSVLEHVLGAASAPALTLVLRAVPADGAATGK